VPHSDSCHIVKHGIAQCLGLDRIYTADHQAYSGRSDAANNIAAAQHWSSSRTIDVYLPTQLLFTILTLPMHAADPGEPNHVHVPDTCSAVRKYHHKEPSHSGDRRRAAGTHHAQMLVRTIAHNLGFSIVFEFISRNCFCRRTSVLTSFMTSCSDMMHFDRIIRAGI